jgi:hypothetical protein
VWVERGFIGREYGGNINNVKCKSIGIVTMNPPYNEYILIKIIKKRNEKQEIRANTKEIQEITRKYLKNLYSIKLENLEELDKFLDIYAYSQLKQE